jgi:hypothetical protein
MVLSLSKAIILGVLPEFVKQRPNLSQGPIVKQEILHGSVEAPANDRFGHIMSAS